VSTLAPDQYLADLNEAQREAVTTTEGPLLVIAGAGSGKTRVLTYPGRAPDRRLRGEAERDPRDHVHEQGGGRDARAARGPARRGRRAIWILTFHAACGRILRREAPRLGYKSNFSIYDQADQVRLTKQCLEDLERDPKRFVPRGIHAQISNAKNQLIGPADYMSRVDSFYDQTVAEVYELYQKRCTRERDGLRRPADAHRRGAGALPRGAREVAEGVPVRAGRRVPGHEPRAVPAAPAARRQAPEPDGRRRPGPVDLRIPGADHHEHPRLREGLPGHEGDPLGAELPLDEHDPRRVEPRSSAQPASARRRTLVGSSARGAPCHAIEVEDEHAEGAVRRRRDRALVEEGYSADEVAVFYRTNAQSRVLEDVLVRHGIRLPGDRRPAFYERGRRSWTRSPTCSDRQPIRPDLAAAGSPTAKARDRRRDALAAAGLRRRPRDLDVRGARLPGGGRASAPLR
jgi:DNA helicase-2/ATP-dependent DNA helicase PcrA